MQRFNRWLPVAGALSAGLLVSNTPGALAQTVANVTVNASSSTATIPPAAFGSNVGCGDGEMVGPNVTSALKSAGVSALRYPGGGSADFFHWQTTSATPGSGGWVNSNDTFDTLMTQLAQPIGALPVITVNYGSNAAGTGGGDPNEAAAWVDYANNTKKYGIKYWEIGNEVYGNGEYGGSGWEEDLHSAKDPATYGANVVQYVNAMKAKDPTIKVGVVLTTPGSWPDGVSPDWNSNVLAQCGGKIDAVIVHYYAQGPGGESDAGLLSSSSQVSGLVTKLKSLINQYCGSNAPNVQIWVTEMNSCSGNIGKQTVSLVNALFAADVFMTWLENGAANLDWFNVHNGPGTTGNNSSSLYGSATYGDYGLLAVGGSIEPPLDTPFPSYYAVQMLTNLGKAGDTIVPATTDQSLLTAHAVKQANGKLALLLINKDPNNSYAANISLNGYTPASSATQYFYGKTSSAITSSSVSAGSSFSVTVPPYSLTTIVMARGVNYSSNISNGNHAVVPQNDTGARLDAYNYSSANGTKVEMWNGSGQTWAFVNEGGGVYQISESWSTGACLDVYNGGGSGTKTDIWSCWGGPMQHWGAIGDGGNVYEFEPQCALGTRLDVYGGGSASGTQVDIWTANGGSNQKWAIN